MPPTALPAAPALQRAAPVRRRRRHEAAAAGRLALRPVRSLQPPVPDRVRARAAKVSAPKPVTSGRRPNNGLGRHL